MLNTYVHKVLHEILHEMRVHLITLEGKLLFFVYNSFLAGHGMLNQLRKAGY